MAFTIKAPSGRRIWSAVRDELMLNLYPLLYSTLAPTIYHVYLHPDDFEIVECIAPRIVAQVQHLLKHCVGKSRLLQGSVETHRAVGRGPRVNEQRGIVLRFGQ